MIEMIGVEIIDCAHPRRTGANKRIDLHVLVKVCSRFRTHLIGVVLADDTLAGLRVVRLADLGEQQEAHVVHLKS